MDKQLEGGNSLQQELVRALGGGARGRGHAASAAAAATPTAEVESAAELASSASMMRAHGFETMTLDRWGEAARAGFSRDGSM